MEEKSDKSTVVVYRNGKTHDVTLFLEKHPGGADSIRHLSTRDVTGVMCGGLRGSHNHSRAAYSLLHEYTTSEKEDGTTVDLLLTEKDELEKLVDWNRGLVWQVSKLGARYKDWLDLPVDRRMLLFDSPLLEQLTSTPWYLVPSIWTPVVLYLLFLGATSYESIRVVWIVWHFLSGVLAWTLTEYILHRFLFHMQVPSHSPVFITLHFLLHGLHHKTPFDQGRLVFPPLGALMLIIPVYFIMTFVMSSGPGNLMCSGALMGYVAYDVTHYYLHHGQPKKGSYFHKLKRYHTYHHFLQHDLGYGVSSKFWDSYFGTEIKFNGSKKL